MNKNIFKLDKDFLRELRRRISNPEKFALRINSQVNIMERKLIPDLSQLEEIILTLMWASIQHEEGEPIKTKLIFAQPLMLSRFSVTFEMPKPFNVQEIKKLAPGIMPVNGHIVVGQFGSSKNLYILGLQNTRLLNLTFEIIDPGRIVISFMNNRIAEISGDKSGLLDIEKSSLYLNLFSSSSFDDSESRWLLAMKNYFYITFTQELLQQIRTLGHGGTVIFVPENGNWKKHVDKPIYYHCLESLNNVSHAFEWFEKELNKINRLDTLGDIGKAKEAMEIFASYSFKAIVAEASKCIASLTKIDGATILNERFELLGFGIKLKYNKKARSKELVSMHSLFEKHKNAKEVVINNEFKGTRHLSSARFVGSVLGSRGFVISQDGGITCFLSISNSDKNSSELLAFKDVELVL